MTAEERLALVRPKIERANKHIDDLQTAVRSFLDSKPYKVATKRDPETRKLIYYVANVEPVPITVPTIAGDIINSLRSALDHLAQQLYLVGTGDAKGYRDQTSFPIAPSAKEFETGLPRKVEGMRQDAVDAIKALEPYKGGKGEDLWSFNRLNNIDKHRVIVTVGSHFRSMNFGPIASRMIEKTFPKGIKVPDFFLRPADNLFPLNAGAELYIDAPDAELNEKIQFVFEVVIHEPGVIEGKALIEAAVEFRDRVSSIVEAFRPCLA